MTVAGQVDLRSATDDQLRTLVDTIRDAFPNELTEPFKVLAEVSRRLTELQHRREAEAGTRYVHEFTAEALADLYGGEIADRYKLREYGDAIRLTVQHAVEHDRRHSVASPSSPASGVRVIGYVTEEALKLMLTVKPKSGWHYHMFAKDQADAKATIAIYASDAAALSALGEHP